MPTKAKIKLTILDGSDKKCTIKLKSGQEYFFDGQNSTTTLEITKDLLAEIYGKDKNYFDNIDPYFFAHTYLNFNNYTFSKLEVKEQEDKDNLNQNEIKPSYVPLIKATYIRSIANSNLHYFSVYMAGNTGFLKLAVDTAKETPVPIKIYQADETLTNSKLLRRKTG